MKSDFQAEGGNTAALFTLKLHRGDGMALVAMNWKKGKPPLDLAGFAIEYKEPGGNRFFALKNRISFPDDKGNVNPKSLSTRLSPIQKFRWVHFPRNADLSGEFVYRVTPVFMNDSNELSYGESQEASIELRRETYPGQLNVSFTRGYISSQAFVERYESAGPISDLLPDKASRGLDFVPTHPKAEEALAWMGFEARSAIIETLDQAVADKKAQVSVIAYDLCEPEVVHRLVKLKNRLRIIIDDSKEHKASGSSENKAEELLSASAGIDQVKRQHMSGLQHNKIIIVEGPKVKAVVCGSTNFSWRGFYVQSNNAMILRGASAIRPFLAAFEEYWLNKPKSFTDSESAIWNSLKIKGIDARVTFSPHGKSNEQLNAIAKDIGDKTSSSLFFSLAGRTPRKVCTL